MERDAIICSSGVFTPPEKITNQELVGVYNQYVDLFNEENRSAIEAGLLAAQCYSDSELIKAETGIESRYVLTRHGLTDPDVMMPLLTGSEDVGSCQAKLAAKSARIALQKVSYDIGNVDLIVVCSSHFERATPAVSVEVQSILGHKGMAYDLNAGSAGLVVAMGNVTAMIRAGMIGSAVVIAADIGSSYINFRDRNTHYLSGDGACALLLCADNALPEKEHLPFVVRHFCYESQLDFCQSNFFGVLNRSRPDLQYAPDKLLQIDKKRKNEQLKPLIQQHWKRFFDGSGTSPELVKRFWLQQSSYHFNRELLQLLVTQEHEKGLAPTDYHGTL